MGSVILLIVMVNGGMEANDVKRLKELEEEMQSLKNVCRSQL